MIFSSIHLLYNNRYIHEYTLHAAPGLVTLIPLSSTSINVRWSPPPNSDRLPLTYHVNYTGMSRSTSDTNLTLTGLHPYEEYTISVQAGNKGGLSVPVTGTARTYSDSELVVWTGVVECVFSLTLFQNLAFMVSTFVGLHSN